MTLTLLLIRGSGVRAVDDPILKNIGPAIIGGAYIFLSGDVIIVLLTHRFKRLVFFTKNDLQDINSLLQHQL